MTEQQRPSQYLDYLPALFQEDPFIGQFLLAFERMFSGLPGTADIPPEAAGGQPPPDGFDAVLDRMGSYVTPLAGANQPPPLAHRQTPVEFLPWLAQWVALSLRDDWSEETKRSFISRMVPLYRKRGTKAGMTELLSLYTQEEVEIYEPPEPAHYFQVEMTLSEPDPQLLRVKERIARMIIDQEKPAHTFYALRVRVPTMRIVNQPGVGQSGLILGVNTLLGTDSSL